MKRFDITFETVASVDGNEEESRSIAKIVTDKTFPEVAAYAESMIGKTRGNERIVGVREVERYSDVDVI
jgi:hypothetical protein